MVSREQIETIIGLAMQAPSGDNAQPWRFEVENDAIRIYNVPGKDYSPYNFRERGSLFANGALIENAVVAATSFGYETFIQWFPDIANQNYLAKLSFSKNNKPSDPLIESIKSRSTNRKPYLKTPLRQEHKKQLFEEARSMQFGDIHFIEDLASIQQFAKIVSLSDRLIFEEKSIHDAIFASIRWTQQEEQEKHGMYIKTLELPPPAQVLFKMLKNWSILMVFNYIGISRFIALQSANNYAASSAIGILIIPDDTNESYIKAGMTFERIWLKADQLGVSVQPVTALAYLAKRVSVGDAGELSFDHTKEITETQNNILKLFGNPSGTVAMMFRMGYGASPSAHSHKSAPIITYLT
jgi:hypothetical protein